MIVLLIGAPHRIEFLTPENTSIRKIFSLKQWRLFKRISEGETCFNALIGYKNLDTLKFISICFFFVGIKIYLKKG